MLNIQTFKGSDLPPFLAQGMSGLTNDGSAHFHWLTDIANDGMCESMPHDLVYSVCELDDDFDIVPIGWASVYLWDGLPAIEAYVHRDFRRKHLASACVAVLMNSVTLPGDSVAVFSDEVEAIANWLGGKKVIRYIRRWTDDPSPLHANGRPWVRRDAE